MSSFSTSSNFWLWISCQHNIWHWRFEYRRKIRHTTFHFFYFVILNVVLPQHSTFTFWMSSWHTAFDIRLWHLCDFECPARTTFGIHDLNVVASYDSWLLIFSNCHFEYRVSTLFNIRHTTLSTSWLWMSYQYSIRQ